VAKICKPPVVSCNTDADCKSGYYCDTAEHICKARRQLLYVGGQAGCSMGAGQGASGTATGVIALFGLALLGLVAHGRRRLAAAVDGSA
jgi:MYXO-CTERM domain-containing protein